MSLRPPPEFLLEFGTCCLDLANLLILVPYQVTTASAREDGSLRTFMRWLLVGSRVAVISISSRMGTGDYRG